MSNNSNFNESMERLQKNSSHSHHNQVLLQHYIKQICRPNSKGQHSIYEGIHRPLIFHHALWAFPYHPISSFSWIPHVGYIRYKTPQASSIAYPVAMFPLGLLTFIIKPFRAIMYLSMGYIHLVWTGPQISNSFTRWTTRRVITSKQARRNTFSNIAMVFATFTLSCHGVWVNHFQTNCVKHSIFF